MKNLGTVTNPLDIPRKQDIPTTPAAIGAAAASHTHLLAAGATDVTATVAELNQLHGIVPASELYVQSRGTDLVANGYGTYGTNRNFSMFTFTAVDAPTGAAGSFLSAYGISATRNVDEFLPVDPYKKMMLACQIRQTGASNAGYLYTFLSPYDAYKNLISPTMYMYQPNTLTTLAAPLNVGDTTITLTSSANWYGSVGKPAGANTHYRIIIWWDFTDAGGKLWPPLTYSRNYSAYDLWADGGITGNVITLRVPYAGPAKAAGTQLSDGSSGGSFMYGQSNIIVPKTWTRYVNSVVGLVPGGNNAAAFGAGWPPGVGFCKVGFLVNRTITGASEPTSQHAVAAVSFSDASAAEADAVSALTTKANIASPALTGTPTAPTGAVTLNTTQLATIAWVRALSRIGTVTGGNDFNTFLQQGEYYIGASASITNAPYTGGMYGKLRVIVSDGLVGNDTSNWVWQYVDDTSGRTYMRYKVNTNAWTAWFKVWTGNNDGSGSGLDADLLRGTTPSTAGLAILDDADAAAQIATLGAVATGDSRLSDARIPVAHTHVYLDHPDDDRTEATPLPNTTIQTTRFSFKNGSVLGGTIGSFIGVMTLTPFDGTSLSMGDCSYQLAFGSTTTNGGNPRLAIRNGIDTTWNSWKDILTSDNCTAAGLALLDDANAAAQLVTLGALPLAGGTMTGPLTTTQLNLFKDFAPAGWNLVNVASADAKQLFYSSSADNWSGLGTDDGGNTWLRTGTAGSNLFVFCATGGLGIGVALPNANAILDVVSTTKAFMPPRMTTTQRDAIASPTEGMVIYNLTTHVLNFHNGTVWDAV